MTRRFAGDIVTFPADSEAAKPIGYFAVMNKKQALMAARNARAYQSEEIADQTPEV